MNRALVSHCCSIGIALAVAAAALAAEAGKEPWLVAYLALSAALTGEAAGWLWRQVHPLRPPEPKLQRNLPPPTKKVRAVPLREARVSDLGLGEFVRVQCVCGRAEVLTAATLATAGVPPQQKMVDLGRRMHCEDCAARGCALVSVKRGKVSGRS